MNYVERKGKNALKSPQATPDGHLRGGVQGMSLSREEGDISGWPHLYTFCQGPMTPVSALAPSLQF